jgi:ATP synthase protein I
VDEERDSASDRRQGIRQWSVVWTASIQMAVSVVLMFFVGRWLDGKFGTDPWLMIVGLFFGVGAGFYHFIRTLSTLGNEKKNSSSG